MALYSLGLRPRGNLVRTFLFYRVTLLLIYYFTHCKCSKIYILVNPLSFLSCWLICHYILRRSVSSKDPMYCCLKVFGKQIQIDMPEEAQQLEDVIVGLGTTLKAVKWSLELL